MPRHLYKILHEVDKSNEGIQNFPLIFTGKKKMLVGEGGGGQSLTYTTDYK